jgi:2-iminobutanoate/2-iminopropanoate deaminase
LTKRSVYVETSPKPSGHYSQGIVANGLVYLAGVGPYDPVTRAVVGKTIEDQTAQVLRNVDAVLAGAGCRFADVVNCTAYLAQLDRDWDAFDAAYGSFFEPPYPARTTVGAELKGILVELSVVAVLGA